jgi:DNA-binding PadR family transcriptional regulator
MRPFGRRPGHFGGGGFGGHHEGGRWGSGHHHGGRSRILAASELRLLLASLIATESRHGYELIRAIEQLSAGAYAPSPGVVYPALALMEDVVHIAPVNAEGGRKAFAIAPAGLAELAARATEIDALKARLAALPSLQRDQHAPIRRAMDNLKTVLGNSITRLQPGVEHEIAALIDDAAQKIERLG